MCLNVGPQTRALLASYGPHSWRKLTPTPNGHQLPIAPHDRCFVTHCSICARILAGSILYRSSTCSPCFCEFIGAISLLPPAMNSYVQLPKLWVPVYNCQVTFSRYSFSLDNYYILLLSSCGEGGRMIKRAKEVLQKPAETVGLT